MYGKSGMEQQVIQGLIARGVPPHIAQGMTANMIAESNLNPGINEIAPLVPGSRGGYGLNQWTGPRRVAYEKFAAERGAPMNDLNTQLDFTMYELQGPEAKAWAAIQGAADPIEAARLYSEKFLRPGIPHMDRRLSEAARLAGLPVPTVTASTKGGAVMADGGLLGAPEAPKKKGLAGLLSDPDKLAMLAIGLEGMTLNPNAALVSMLGGQVQERRETKKADASRNRTVQWLRSVGQDQLAAALETGAVDPGAVVGQALQAMQPVPAEPPKVMQVGDSIVSIDPATGQSSVLYTAPGGTKADIREVGGKLVQVMPDGTTKEVYAPPPSATPGYRQVKGAELGMTGPDAEKMFNVSPEGQVTAIGGGGTTVNVDTAGGKFEEAFAKGDADTIKQVYDVGLAATRNIGRIEQLDALLRANPSGMGAALTQFAGELGISVAGLDQVQAAQAIINSLVPEQRQPGSGPMSDADLALFKQSLPRIINQPGGNQIIVDTMKAIAKYDAEGAAIVQRLRSGEISRAQAFEMLQSRANPLAGPPPVRKKYNPATGAFE